MKLRPGPCGSRFFVVRLANKILPIANRNCRWPKQLNHNSQISQQKRLPAVFCCSAWAWALLRAALSNGGNRANNLTSYADAVKMVRTKKQHSSDKNKKQASSAGQGELPGILAEESENRPAEKASRYRFLDCADVVKELNDGRPKQKSLFLGNGFNLAIGVNTSYASLSNSLLEHATVEQLFRKIGLYQEIKSRPAETEQIIGRIKDHYHCAFVKEIFYDGILQRARSRYKYKEVAEFLEPFDMYFTTNYDPLLYLLLLSMEGEDPDEDWFYRRIRRIFYGWVRARRERTRTPLEGFTLTQLYDIAVHIMKDDLPPKKRKLFFKVIRHIKGEPFIHLNDGFMGPGGEDPTWSASLELGEGDVNLFYLHGGTFLYEEGRTIKKRISNKRKRFITMLAEAGWPMCVFEATSPEKLDKIQNNRYLSYCQERLSEIRGDLCIVGWSCQDCDDHLIDCINENKNLTRLFISYYREDDTSINEVADWYGGKFKNKEIVFWDVSTAPFFKEKKQRRAAKR